MALSEQVLQAGLVILIAGLKEHLFPIAKVRLMERQREVYEEKIEHIMKRDGTTRDEVMRHVGEFIPDEAKAEKDFHGYVDNGIAYRLMLAIRSYQAKDHIQCVRGILLAMETFASLDRSEEDYDRLRRLDNKLLEAFDG